MICSQDQRQAGVLIAYRVKRGPYSNRLIVFRMESVVYVVDEGAKRRRLAVSENTP